MGEIRSIVCCVLAILAASGTFVLWRELPLKKRFAI